MLNSLVQAFKVPELRNKILFTLGILALYRLGAYIPVPGIPFHAFADAFSEQGVGMAMLDLFTGGALSNPASGNGKTAGRGMNGQKSRAGGGKGAGFEGGQTPLARRLPKLPGFRNFNRVEYVPVNVSRLDAKFNAGDLVDADTLYAAGIIKNTTDPIKVLGDGEITKALTVRVDKVSASARAKIEAVGGKVEAPC